MFNQFSPHQKFFILSSMLRLTISSIGDTVFVKWRMLSLVLNTNWKINSTVYTLQHLLNFLPLLSFLVSYYSCSTYYNLNFNRLYTSSRLQMNSIKVLGGSVAFPFYYFFNGIKIAIWALNPANGVANVALFFLPLV